MYSTPLFSKELHCTGLVRIEIYLDFLCFIFVEMIRKLHVFTLSFSRQCPRQVKTQGRPFTTLFVSEWASLSYSGHPDPNTAREKASRTSQRLSLRGGLPQVSVHVSFVLRDYYTRHNLRPVDCLQHLLSHTGVQSVPVPLFILVF